MHVVRGDAVEDARTIYNIFIDENNRKYIGTDQGVYIAHAIDIGEKLPSSAGAWQLLAYPDGNANLELPKAAIQKIMGDQINQISCASYESRSGLLWIGTEDNGIYHCKVDGQSVSLVKHMTSDNSKLDSDIIYTMYMEDNGALWVGTDQGLYWTRSGKDMLIEPDFDVRGIAPSLRGTYLVAGGFLWEARTKKNWEPVDFDEDEIKGVMVDVAVDNMGQIWIASEIITRYNPDDERYRRFDGGDDFTSEFTRSIVIDSDNALWVATEDKGLYLIEKADAISVSIKLEKGVSCKGAGNDAALKVITAGGKPPYTYAWSGGLSGEQPSGLGPGEYSLTVTDSRKKRKISGIKVPDPGISVQVTSDKPTSAIGAEDGVATAQAEGGSGLLTYAWDNGETTEIAVKLTAGTHSVTVSDNSGCQAVGEVTISETVEQLQVSIDVLEVIQCAGAETASLAAKVRGGKPPYQYEWSNNRTAELLTALPSGNYSVQVTDAKGTKQQAQVSIPDATPISLQVDVLAAASTGNSDGQAKAKVRGGSGNFSYAWDTGESTEKATKLGPGNHGLTVTDGSGCTTAASFDISENILDLQASIDEGGAINCTGEATASLLANVRGGKPPYSYKWSSGGSAEQEQNLKAGTYTVTITDASAQTKTLDYQIEEPKPLTVTANATDPASTGNSDGRARVKASGGTGKYTYKWDSGETDEKAKALAPGTHTVTVTDEKGCTAIEEVTITENILDMLVNLEETQSIKCFGDNTGVLSTQIRGGKPPFSYAWNQTGLSGEKASDLKTGIYEVTITDASGQTTTASWELKQPDQLAASAEVVSPASTGNSDGQAKAKANGGKGKYSYKWDNGETDNFAKALAPGVHTVSITDGNGCIATAEVEIKENILELQVSLDQTSKVNCYGDQTAGLKAVVRGGKPPYTFEWEGQSITGEALSGIGSGTYNLAVKDAIGTLEKVSFKVDEPTAVVLETSMIAPASTGNSDGKASVTASGGMGKYTYKWDSGETEASAGQLSPGVHQVTVTDAAGCTKAAEVNITEDIKALQVDVAIEKEINCHGDEASVKINVRGGKPPFTYTWGQAGLSGNQITVPAGSYALTIVDASGQQGTASVALDQPEPIEARLRSRRGASSKTAKNGAARVVATGGSGRYTYTWDNGEDDALAKRLRMGDHKVTVTDEAGCSLVLPFEIRELIIPELIYNRLSIGQAIRLDELVFEADSSRITPQSIPILTEVYEFLDDHPQVTVEIGGHTNDIPPDDYCDFLSTARAQAVSDFLVDKGIPRTRVPFKGYGKRNPVVSNKTPEGRRRNQRVEIKVMELDAG